MDQVMEAQLVNTDDSSEDPQPAIDNIQVTVDSSTISGPSVCETLTHQQIVDDSVSNVSLDDSLLVEDNNTQCSLSELPVVEDDFTNPLVTSDVAINSPMTPF